MPYLHWDVVAQPGVPISTAEPGERPTTPYQKLLAAYRDDDDPLHVRRTLDQYFYHMLQNTRSRDTDQVISRFQSKHHLKPAILTMVDQLWLWVVSDSNPKSYEDASCFTGKCTIITCFPQVTPKGDNIDVPDCRGLADVLTSITAGLRYELDIDPRKLVSLIISTCSGSLMDQSSHLVFGQTLVRFSDAYESTIKDAVSAPPTHTWLGNQFK